MNTPDLHVFGPIPSRRLGRSLGVDVIPKKVCTLDCIYCELGRTDKRALRRKEYLPEQDIVRDIKEFLRTHDGIDVITFSGSGEPTLHAGLGRMIRAVKEWTTIPVAVLTNGTLLSQSDVRRDLLEADIVLPSLDAVTEATFRMINRPHPRIRLHDMIEGLKQFRKEFKGQLWVEILFVEGVNDSPAEIAQLKEVLAEVRPDRIQLNTVVRPPAERSAHPLSEDRLRELEEFFGSRCENIGGYRPPERHPAPEVRSTEVVAVLRRRAMTLQELGQSLEAPPSVILRSLALLEREELVFSFVYRGRKYYQAFESMGDPLAM